MKINETHTVISPTSSSEGSAQNPAQSAAVNAEAVRAQRQRIPMSVPRRKLDAPEIPGFWTYWFRDDGARLHQAMRAGYTFVTEQELIDAGGMSNNGVAYEDPNGSTTDLTSQVSIFSGVAESGNPQRLVLMKLPRELRAEDEAEAARIARVPMDTIMRGKALQTQYSTGDDKSYIPADRPISLKSGVHRTPRTQS